VREAVFAGKTTPMVFGQPQPWIASLVEALQADAGGDETLAARLRADAFEAAPATPGTLDGVAFEWIADADSRLGPVLEVLVNGRYGWLPFAALSRVSIEAPADLRDLVWLPAHLGFANGGEAVALIPSRYPGSAAQADAALQLSRKTEWRAIGPQQFRGLGQRILTTDASELGLLEARDIVLEPAPPAEPLR
jgi:type VI secretion system protein ImpE